MSASTKADKATAQATDCFHVSQHYDAFLVACANCIREAMLRAIAEARAEEREACAMLHESIDVACDHERLAGHSGAGAMRAVILYRDAIRARGGKPDVE